MYIVFGCGYIYVCCCSLYVLLSVPVFNDSVAPTIDKLVYYPEEHVEVVPGEYLVTVHPETDCECHMTVTCH